ncbi:hypothetical protein Micbo1qcDRAFT_171969 [Microdochium bolleyi]|uniref:Uncharacterized protein n=1 Tax=Microdochium bolleyi TaxID=196109 RepID=A0A136JEV1_9PEZI|nr:hypothetical protein Micbo1qcDRAFT_171969 [Microdochium bolleyi]
MRLLHFESDKLVLTNFTGKPIPAYAILSHRWTSEEVLFDNVKRGNFKEDSAGWRKIKFCAEKAAADGLKFFWCDTCCINKWDMAELARSVNSMFKYYRDAAKCYVYLQDTQATTSVPAASQLATSIDQKFRQNEWFKRGWTLQELVAPSSVEFFNEEGERLGDRSSYRQTIHEITGIPLGALGGDLDKFSRENRLKWAEGRVTTEPEDGAYCLLGILGVQMPLTYGEGREKAFARLHRELEADTNAPCLIPFSRKDYTIGYTIILRQLEERLFGHQKARLLTIVGEGGLGKSHLALEFAYSTRESRPECSVFWCDASTVDSLHQSYSDIAQKLRVASDQDQPEDVRTSLHRYLGSHDAGEWLLVYDNVSDASTMSAALGIRTSESLTLGLPESSSGSILLTTRNFELASAISSDSIRIAELDVSDSAAMLQCYLADVIQPGDQSTTIAQLARMLRRPLAVVITAAYIRTESIAVDEYITQFERWAREVQADSSTLSTNADPVEKVSLAEQSTNQVIRFTLRRIMGTNPAAAECFLELACLHRADVPLGLLYACHQDKTQDILTTLDNYALITRLPALSAIDMHSLVHLAVRQELDKLEHRDRCVVWVASKLLDTFPEVDEDSRSQWRRLLPHARELDNVAHASEKPALLGLKYRCGKALFYDGRYHEAKELQAEVLETAKRLKLDGDFISVSMANLAMTVAKLGQWKEAEELQVQTLDTSETALEDHAQQINRLASMNNLASTYSSQGRWKEAEALQLKAVEASKAAFGVDHHLTLSIMANLAMTVRDQGRWQEAADLQLQVTEAMTRTAGEDHPGTLTSKGALAMTYRCQGKLEDAEAVLTEVLANEKVVLGPSHPSTLMTMSHLATVIGDRGRYKDAEKLQLQVLEANRQVLGEAHTDTMSCANNLSNLYVDQGRWREAGDILSKLLETAKTVMGDDHPSVLTCRNNLTGAYLSQKRFQEAEKLQVEALRVGKTVLGQDHPDLITTMSLLASAVDGQRRWVEARGLHEEVLRRCQTTLGLRHPHTLVTMTNLAMTYLRLHRWRDAEWFMVEVFRSRKAVFGHTHPKTLKAKDNIDGIFSSYMRRFDPSSEWRMFRFVLVVRVSHLYTEISR